jgi:hypothetical protein
MNFGHLNDALQGVISLLSRIGVLTVNVQRVMR